VNARRLFIGFTPFDLPLLVFVATAAIGVWAAYDRPAAWAKLAMLVVAAAVYYVVALQPQTRLWRLAAAWEGVAAGVAVFFLLTFDWQRQPADFAWLTALSLRWMSVRPTLPGFMTSGVAGGLLAMLVPFALALEVRAWRERRIALLGVNTAVTALIAIGFLLTSSRAAWAALAAGLALWGAASLVGRLPARQRRMAKGAGVLLVVAVVVLALALADAHPGAAVALLNRLPGAPDGASRYDMAQGALRLMGDFVFTGGGLGAFAGLYSTYIRVIQVVLFTYSHDLFLDVGVEQGALGLLALLAVLGGSLGLLAAASKPKVSAPDADLLRHATLASLVAICLHGLLDDALYGNGGTSLLFVTAGMAVGLAQAHPVWMKLWDRGRRPAPWVWGIAGAASVLAVAGIFVFIRPLLSLGYSNLGAVELSQWQLAGWPDQTQAVDPADLAEAQSMFEQAAALDPQNRTAQQRLGELALQQRDFDLAVTHLEAAYQIDPGHRGVRKELGYALVWQGRLSGAAPLLQTIPEAVGELNTYAWWWKTQGRPDLALRSAEMAGRLGPSGLQAAGQWAAIANGRYWR